MQKIHQRMTADLPINAVVSPAIVDDPYQRGDKLRVLRSVRDDPLAGMHARGQIDDALLAAGRKWQAIQEQAEIGSISAMDPTKEPVDGGKMHEPITDRQIQALRKISIAAEKLGHEGHLLVSDILTYRKSIREAAERRGMFTESEIKYTGRRFRECLETLAIHWGFAMADR